MDTLQIELALAVEKVLDAAATDTTDALCRLSTAHQAFDREASALRSRLSALPAPAAPPAVAAVPCNSDDAIDSAIPDRLLQLFWLLLVAGIAVAFSAGFWLGRGS